MRTIHRSRTVFSVFAAVLAFALAAPIAVHAEDEVIADEQVLATEEQDPALAPAIPSWDEASGYGSVEASRAAASAMLAPVAAPSWDDTSGYGSVEASRAAIGHDDAVSGDTVTGHEASAAIGRSWDDISGYGSVERTRAEVSALLSGEVISGQEQALAIAAAAAKSWDETSGYGSVEASRAGH